MKRAVSTFMFVLLLVNALTFAFNTQSVKASGTIYIRADGSVDPPTANITSSDYVTYTFTDDNTGSIVVERSSIVIDGDGYVLEGSRTGYGFYLSGITNVTIQNTEISNFSFGIYLNQFSSHNSICQNNITANTQYGIYLGDPGCGTICPTYDNITGNIVTGNGCGMFLYSGSNVVTDNNVTSNSGNGIYLAGSASSDSVLRNNKMADNKYNFGVDGAFTNDVDTSNTANGKPLYYWVDKQNLIVPLDAGYVALVNCENITVQDLSLANNSQGIILASTQDTAVSKNNVTSNCNNIVLYSSSNNSIYGNNVINNNYGSVGYGILLVYSSNYNSIVGNNIKTNHFSCGIIFTCFLAGSYSTHNNIIENNITGEGEGISIFYSSDNVIVGNNITTTWDGIRLDRGSNTTMRNNTLACTVNNFGIVYANDVSDFVQHIDTSNTIHGKPIYYWIGHKDETIPPDAGYVALINSNNITVRELEFASYNLQQILLFNTTDSQIVGNKLKVGGYYEGIWLFSSSNNSISGNNIAGWGDVVRLEASSCGNSICENEIGTVESAGYRSFRIISSSNNKIYHNTIPIAWESQVISQDSTNVWDDGYPSGGNYWNAYKGVDLYSGPYQNETGSDGIGDGPYVIDPSNVDHYPLIRQCILTISSTPGGATSPTAGNYTYNEGTVVQVTGIPDSNSKLDHWELDGVNTGATNPINVTMDADHTLEAIFTSTQYDIIFDQTGVGSSFTGTVVTIDGTNYTAGALPVSFLWNQGSVHSFSYASPLSVGAGEQSVWTSTSGLSTLQSDSATVSSSGSVTGNYKTQYYVAVSSVHDLPSPSSGWFDSGSSITDSITSPVSGGSGVQYVCTGWTGTGSVPASGSATSVTFTISAPSTITWNWKTQYQVTFDQTGAGTDFAGAVANVDSVDYGVGSLPVSFWWDSGSSHSFSFASPLTVGSKQYVWNSTSGISTLQSGTLIVTGSGSVVGNYVQYDIAVTNIASSKTVIGQGYCGNLTLAVQNLGSFTEEFNVTVYANSTIINTLTFNLTSGSTTTQDLLWNTTSFDNGNYTISAYAWPVPGETDTSDNNFTDGWVIVSLIGDITGPNGWPDGKVDMRDIGLVAQYFGLTVPPANPNCDITGPTQGVPDGKIDMRDIGTVAKHFGDHYP